MEDFCGEFVGVNLWRTIWKLKIPNKIKNFWWRVCRNGLATKENLFRRKCAQFNTCPICHLEVETIEHLLFFFPWTRAVWFGCSIVFDGVIGRPDLAIKWTAHILDSMSKQTAMNFLSKITFTAWNIWKARNDYVFRKEKVNPMVVMAKANFAQMELSSACVIPSVHMDNQPIADAASSWVAPNISKFKANCDVTFKEGDTNNKVTVVF
ncbi:hypothetical protein RHMOL_Rhmol10G0272400 [Rhododendron molle]|uniref:Uncharacterized protein n=1 Tax=Rhododendron molle TaxID=49168 RepID=A0ACC0M6P3_RHOML|nr:hypothetical protein RHMOL_Rhmol10G0272400 [Rhododendron molle]